MTEPENKKSSILSDFPIFLAIVLAGALFSKSSEDRDKKINQEIPSAYSESPYEYVPNQQTITPVKINGTNGYEIVSDNNTNYYMHQGDFNFVRVNELEQVVTNIPVKKTIETNVQTNYPMYKIEKVLR